MTRSARPFSEVLNPYSRVPVFADLESLTIELNKLQP